MSDKPETALATLDATQTGRDEAIARLQELFGQDQISMGDLERRVDMVEAATSRAELDQALDGLPVALSSALVPVPEDAGTTAWAILSSTERRGQWHPTPRVRPISVMGSTLLDFTQAVIDGDVVIDCAVVFGNVRIIVPPDVRVECSGMGVMGSFSHFTQNPARSRGVIRVKGYAVMGSVDVQMKRKGLLTDIKERLLGTEP